MSPSFPFWLIPSLTPCPLPSPFFLPWPLPSPHGPSLPSQVPCIIPFPVPFHSSPSFFTWPLPSIYSPLTPHFTPGHFPPSLSLSPLLPWTFLSLLSSSLDVWAPKWILGFFLSLNRREPKAQAVWKFPGPQRREPPLDLKKTMAWEGRD